MAARTAKTRRRRTFLYGASCNECCCPVFVSRKAYIASVSEDGGWHPQYCPDCAENGDSVGRASGDPRLRHLKWNGKGPLVAELLPIKAGNPYGVKVKRLMAGQYEVLKDGKALAMITDMWQYTAKAGQGWRVSILDADGNFTDSSAVVERKRDAVRWVEDYIAGIVGA